MNYLNRKILVVDDDPDIREIVMLALKGWGYDVHELDNGHHVIETVHDLNPALILLDVMLGQMDGRDICRKLKTSDETRDIPIIIISATHGWHTMHEKNCGADNYVEKPFIMKNLVANVNVLIHR